MDLGIKGKKAVVCASSKGLGRGCAEALAAEGVNLVINARTASTLEQTAKEIAGKYGVSVTPVAGDITDEGLRSELVAACPDADILVNNAGGPPGKMWTSFTREDLESALEANLLTPVFLMQALVPGMMERGWGRVVNITSQSVKAPIPILGLSNTARTGLTGFVAGMSRQVASKGVIVNNLLPGTHDTDRIASFDIAEVEKTGKTMEQVRAERAASLPVKRYGTPEEFGAMCAFLCSQYAGNIVGQNILLDGGGTNVTI